MIIKNVKMVNFLAHKDTEIDLYTGLNVFVGQNGAGKSSAIDAITFALFGQHTRKNNKGLIMRGASNGYASVSFEVGRNEYIVTRKIDSKGAVTAQLQEIQDGNPISIAEGERKQFGESVTRNVEEIIGLEFEKLKIASIVRQGDLQAIIRAKPKEFKELINSIIGIDKLDKAADRLKEAIREFRMHTKNQTGYDDTDLVRVTEEIESAKTERDEIRPRLQDMENRRDIIGQEIAKLGVEMEEVNAKSVMIEKLEVQSKMLVQHIGAYRQKIVKDIEELNEKYASCSKYLDIVKAGTSSEDVLYDAQDKIEDAEKRIHDTRIRKERLAEQLSLASRLKLQKGRCPVCKSEVSRLDPLFDETHIKSEIKKIDSDTFALEKFKRDYESVCRKNQEIVDKVKQASALLEWHKIKGHSDLDNIRQEILEYQNDLVSIPANGTIDKETAYSIGLETGRLYDEVSKLEEATQGFDPGSFAVLRESLGKKHAEVKQLDQHLGALQERVRNNTENITRLESVISELEQTKKCTGDLGRIQNDVYGRDGYVATGLRSWALDAISQYASEYLEKLDTKIYYIRLTEKTRNVTISCMSGGSNIDLQSLSGGEQVSVALALRFGMARLLAVSSLSFVVLDEPTAHLDSYRKKLLVDVLSGFANRRDESAMQFVIITHDEEIFENSAVENIIKFDNGRIASRR